MRASPHFLEKKHVPRHPESSEIRTQAMLYAAQGDIVVALNYAGHDTSSLGYHPHHIVDQQSKDMIDALTAARAARVLLQTALTITPTSSTLQMGQSELPRL